MEYIFQLFAGYINIVVLGICLCTGYIIKHSIPIIDNKYIPLILAILGVVLNVWVHQWTFSPDILLGGLVSGLAATGIHQLVKHLRGKDHYRRW